MAVPVFGLEAPSITLGVFLSAQIDSAPAAAIVTIDAPIISQLSWTVPRVTLTDPVSTFVLTSNVNITLSGGGGGNVAAQPTQSWYFS